MSRWWARALNAALAGGLLVAACAPVSRTPAGPGDTVTLSLGAYTTPREAYGELLPMFAAQWLAETGQIVRFEESYLGSGAQSRAVVEGFEADVVALSLEADLMRIVNAGLITHDWKANQYKGIVSDSVVAFAVRPGNPQGIRDWADLAREGLEVLTPNPETSGGAMWNILALYGAALHGQVAGVPAGDEAAAQAFVEAVLRNVTVFDKSARDSLVNFESGVGDVAISYENEVLVGQANGQTYELVVPAATLLIQNPVAVVDTYVDKHGSRALAEAFVEFLLTREAQLVFAKHGLRSPNPAVLAETADQFPAVPELFTIDDFGGWAAATPKYFNSTTGLYYAAIATALGQ